MPLTYTQLRKRNIKMLDSLPAANRLFGVTRNIPLRRKGNYSLETLIVRASTPAEACQIADDRVHELKIEKWGTADVSR